MLYIKMSSLRLKDLEGIYDISRMLAHYFPNPDHYLTAIYELLMNAIEHGNLGIGCEEKAKLIADGKWKEELARRLALPENAKKELEIALEYTAQECILTITDQGEGFAWKEVLERQIPAKQPNGRGLHIAFNAAFSHISYNPKGNQVKCVARDLRCGNASADGAAF